MKEASHVGDNNSGNYPEKRNNFVAEFFCGVSGGLFRGFARRNATIKRRGHGDDTWKNESVVDPVSVVVI